MKGHMAGAWGMLRKHGWGTQTTPNAQQPQWPWVVGVSSWGSGYERGPLSIDKSVTTTEVIYFIDDFLDALQVSYRGPLTSLRAQQVAALGAGIFPPGPDEFLLGAWPYRPPRSREALVVSLVVTGARPPDTGFVFRYLLNGHILFQGRAPAKYTAPLC